MDEEERKAKLGNLYYMDQLFHELGWTKYQLLEACESSREGLERIQEVEKRNDELREELKVINVLLKNAENMLKDRDEEIVDLREEPKVITCPF